MNRQGFAIIDRFLNPAIVPAICLALCGLAPAGPAKAAAYETFKTPSGNIICGITDTDLECVIKSGLNPAPPKRGCDAGDPVFNRVDLSAAGIAEPARCAGDPGPLADEQTAKVLVDGAALIRGEIGCVTFMFGLVCANSKGHGFFLSRAAVRYF